MVSVASGAVGTDVLTLSANTVTPVNFGEDLDTISAIHGAAFDPSSTTEAIWYTVNGDDPSVGGATSWLLPSANIDEMRMVSGAGNTVVKLLSTGTPKVRVQRGR